MVRGKAVGLWEKANLRSSRLAQLQLLNASGIDRLVFVCKGNVCRSPYAEAVARSLGFSAVSCGLNVSHRAPAEAAAVRIGLVKGLDLSRHLSVSINDIELKRSDCLVAMESWQIDELAPTVEAIGCQKTILGIWRRPPVLRIPDPYGKNSVEFALCFDLIDSAIAGLITQIRKSHANTYEMSKVRWYGRLIDNPLTSMCCSTAVRAKQFRWFRL